ncbi:MAG: GvpL/GvpF family gas vesicle protein [Ekhidna sp.]|nr:GvpL/GvpF family gas vesicle protein [Ekhidna sp.]
MNKLYLYGVIEEKEDRNFGVVDMKKEDPDIIQCASSGELGIIYTHVELEADEEIQATRKNLLNHQKVIERVMESHTILPFSFGLVVETKEDLTKALDDKKEFFSTKLKEIEGKIELNLKGVWNDMGKIYQHIMQTNEEISALKTKLQNQGAPDQADKIELGKKVEYALTLEKERLCDKVINSLAENFEDYRMNKNIAESMFCNLAFMIDASQEAEFDKAVNAVSEELDENITFKYVGPLPPYNFLD